MVAGNARYVRYIIIAVFVRCMTFDFLIFFFFLFPCSRFTLHLH